MTTAALPNDSPYLQWTLDIALKVVMPSDPCIQILYVLAVYNYAMAQLVMICPDQAGQTFFSDLRAKYNLLSFIAGPVISSFDQGTGQSLAKPAFIDGLQIGQLALLNTIWGRAYLDYAQSYGPNIVGVS